jgi:hypothetical protein
MSLNEFLTLNYPNNNIGKCTENVKHIMISIKVIRNCARGKAGKHTGVPGDRAPCQRGCPPREATRLRRSSRLNGVLGARARAAAAEKSANWPLWWIRW